LIELIKHRCNENIINIDLDVLESQNFNSLVTLLRGKLKEKYPKTKLKRTMKSIHYANGFSDLNLKQSAFILDEIEQYLCINKFMNHDRSVEYFNKQIISDGFEVGPESLVATMIKSLFCSERFPGNRV
jgi:hypothetical protein